MSGVIGRCQAAFRDCLLSSRSRVRVAVGALVRGLELPLVVSLGAKVSRSRYVRDHSSSPRARRGRHQPGRCQEPVHGAVSLGLGPDGKRIRRKVSGKTKQEVRAKLQALHQELHAGVRSSSTYTVRDAADDWLREGLDGASERRRTLYEGLLKPMLEVIGARPPRVLSAGDVRLALGRLATRYSTRSLQITHNCLERAIRHAEANDLVGRNVAALVKPPRGRSGPQQKAIQAVLRRRASRPISAMAWTTAGLSWSAGCDPAEVTRTRRPPGGSSSVASSTPVRPERPGRRRCAGCLRAGCSR
jgi:hypothetical protein